MKLLVMQFSPPSSNYGMCVISVSGQIESANKALQLQDPLFHFRNNNKANHKNMNNVE
jgi:hypothetical protein